MKNKIIQGLMFIATIGLAFSMLHGMASIGEPQSLWLMKLIGLM